MDNKVKPVWLVILERLGMIVGVLVAGFALVVIVLGIGDPLQAQGIIYFRVEEVMVGIFGLTIATWVSLIIAWVKYRRIAKYVMLGSLVGFVAWVVLIGAYQTVETKKFVALADTVIPPAGMERSPEPNSNKLYPVPVLDCIDFMNEGCPLITKAWVTNGDEKLDRDDMEKAIADSGWNVIINPAECDFNKAKHNRCIAKGEHEGYDATLSINELGDNWRFSMSLG